MGFRHGDVLAVAIHAQPVGNIRDGEVSPFIGFLKRPHAQIAIGLARVVFVGHNT